MEQPNKKPMGFLNFGYHLLQFLFSKLNKIFDMIVFSKAGSIVVSLIASIIICLGANYEQIGMQLFNDSSTTAQVQEVPVETLYDSSKYEVSGIPSTVTVHLSGSAADIQLFRHQGDVTVVADLQKLEEGSNIVDLSVKNLPSRIKAVIDPATVTATLSKRITQNFDVVSELLVSSNRKESDYDTPTLSATSVKITGTQEQIDSIRTVKAVIDGSNQDGDIDTDATIVAYDAQGASVDVEIQPSTIHATVSLKNTNE